MPSLQIRNLPDDVYQALAMRAGRAKRSLAQQALVELRGEESRSPGKRRREVLESIKKGLQKRPPRLQPAPESLIRSDRER
jgi:hypothetical protein